MLLRKLPPGGYIILLAIALFALLLFPAAAAAADSVVTVSPVNTAPANISQGRQDDFIRFDLTTDQGAAQWTGIHLDLLGTAVAADIAKVKIYKSVDANWSPTDLEIGQGNVVGSVANITLSEPQNITTLVTWHYFVVYTISGSASIGATTGAQLVAPGSTAFIITSPDTVANTDLPFLSLTATIREAPDTVNIRGFNDALISIPKPPAGATRLVSMVQLQPRTESKTATWTAVRVSRTGSSSNAWINSVKIYSATNTAEFDPNYNTLIGTGTIDSTITLVAPQVIAANSTGYYFIVFELNDQATIGSTIGARITGESRFIVDAPDEVHAFKNLDSRLSTFVGEPHGSPGNAGAYVNTNYCSACHNIHMARQNRRILNKLYTSDPSVVNNNSADVYNALCFSCHDGTGASNNIQVDYAAAASAKQKGSGDDGGPVVSPGHLTDQTGTVSGGYLSNTKYNAGVKLPCMVCHDVHQSRNSNYAMMADGLFDYASSSTETTANSGASYYWDSSSTVWASSGLDNYARRKRCEVCHRNAKGSSDTTSFPGTESYVDGKSVVVGIDLGLPASHAAGNKSTSWCGSCHGVHKITIDKPGLGSESAGNVACDECHRESVVAPMQETSSYHHYMQNAGVSNLPSSGTKYPTKSNFNSSETTSTERRCLTCHADHDVFSPATGGVPANGDRGKNLRASIAVIPTAGDTSSFSDSDFDANQGEGGICISCHSVSQTKNTANQKFQGTEDDTQTMVVIKTDYAEATSGHNYEATSSFPGRSYDTTANRPFEFKANCSKCHNTVDNNSYLYDTESDVGSKQDSLYRFQMHASKLRRLLAWLNIVSQDSTQDPLEENFCIRCHSNNTADNPNYGAGKDYYNRASMSAASLGVKDQIIYKAYKHAVDGYRSKHRAIEGTSANWNPAGNRHVECEDCHNAHAAKAIDSNAPVRGGPKGADIGNTAKGVWGVTPSGYSTYTTGTATFTEGSNSVAGSGTSWTSGNVAAGWYIKSNYDMDGRWYKVSSTNYGAQTLTLSQNFDGARAYFDSLPNTATAVEYTAVDVSYSRTTASTYQYEICLKCHSKYSYDDTAPDTPSNNAGGSAAKETDIGQDFNTARMAIHPVTALGKNQPGRADQSELGGGNDWPLDSTGTVTATSGSATVTGSGANWKDLDGAGNSTIVPGWLVKMGVDSGAGPFGTGWYQVESVLSDTTMTITTNYGGTTGSGKSYKLGAGLGNAFVAPWGPWSRMVCSDCHGNDDDAGPRGPHGSAAKWVLKETTASLSFKWFNGNTVQTLTPNNNAVGNGTASTATKAVFCFNCHRRDVYGDVGLTGATADANNSGTTVADALMSRVSHDPTADNNTYASGNVGNWGIVCMNCHGGDSMGGLHGADNMKARDYSTGAIGDAANMFYSGKRLLNGATFIGVKRPTTSVNAMFWTKAGLSYPVPDEVNVSGQSLNGANGDTANYNYDATGP